MSKRKQTESLGSIGAKIEAAAQAIGARAIVHTYWMNYGEVVIQFPIGTDPMTAHVAARGLPYFRHRISMRNDDGSCTAYGHAHGDKVAA